MKNNIFSIIITLNLENKSDGIIYVEGEESLEYQNNKYSISANSVKANSL